MEKYSLIIDENISVHLPFEQVYRRIEFNIFFFFFSFSRAAPAAYGGSQARDLIGAIAAGLNQSHSNVGSEPCLRPTPQLMAMLDP